MTEPTVIQLRKDEDRRIRAGHLWVFSNEIDTGATPLAGLEPGQHVEVRDARGQSLGVGYCNPHSLIAVRLLSRRAGERIDENFLRTRIRRALDLRERLFPGEPYYRLVYGEGDGLPGLIVDRFGDFLVVQPTTTGIERMLETIVPLLMELTGATGLHLRADSPSRRLEHLELYTRTAVGVVPDNVSIRENGVRFDVPVLTGQKTGWFFDHRSNRERLRRYVAGRRVLDAFSYIGGWGVQAAAAGAGEVVCLDSSGPALQGVLHNAGLNGVAGRVAIEQADVFEALQRFRQSEERFDVIVLDPPAFVKRKKDLKEGEQAYRRLNRLGFELLSPGGMLVSASCSFHMSRDLLLRAVLRGATDAGLETQIVEEGHQGPDHPIHPAIPETSYLKVFFVRVLA